MIISDFNILYQELNFYQFINDYLKFYYNEDTIELPPIQSNLIIKKFISHNLQNIQEDDFTYELDSENYQILKNQVLDNQYTVFQANRDYSDEWYHELSEYNRGDIPKTDKYICKSNIDTTSGDIILEIFDDPDHIMFRNLKTTGVLDDYIDIRRQFTPIIYRDFGIERLYNPTLTDQQMYDRINQVTIANYNLPSKLIDIQYEIKRYLDRKIKDEQFYYIQVFNKFSTTGYPEKVVIYTIKIDLLNNIDTNMFNLVDAELYQIYSQLDRNVQIPLQQIEQDVQEFELQIETTLPIPSLVDNYIIENQGNIYVKDINTEINIEHGNQIYNNLVLQSQFIIKQNPSSNSNITIFDRDHTIFDIYYSNQSVNDIDILTGV